MNKTSTQPAQKNQISGKPGVTKILFLLAAMGGLQGMNSLRQANILLTNGGVAPIPNKMLNQRQKRRDVRRGNFC